jgi:hypothetical protein
MLRTALSREWWRCRHREARASERRAAKAAEAAAEAEAARAREAEAAGKAAELALAAE